MSSLRRRAAQLVTGGGSTASVPEVVQNMLVTVAVLGAAAKSVEIQEGATVGDVLSAQGIQNSQEIDIRNSSMKPIRWEDPIEDGETIAVVPKVTGGWDDDGGIFGLGGGMGGGSGTRRPSNSKGSGSKKHKKRGGSSSYGRPSGGGDSDMSDIVETVIDSCGGDDD